MARTATDAASRAEQNRSLQIRTGKTKIIRRGSHWHLATIFKTVVVRLLVAFAIVTAVTEIMSYTTHRKKKRRLVSASGDL